MIELGVLVTTVLQQSQQRMQCGQTSSLTMLLGRMTWVVPVSSMMLTDVPATFAPFAVKASTSSPHCFVSQCEPKCQSTGGEEQHYKEVAGHGEPGDVGRGVCFVIATENELRSGGTVAGVVETELVLLEQPVLDEPVDEARLTELSFVDACASINACARRRRKELT